MWSCQLGNGFNLFFGELGLTERREIVEDVFGDFVFGKVTVAVFGDLPGEILSIGSEPSADELIHDCNLHFGRAIEGMGPSLL